LLLGLTRKDCGIHEAELMRAIGLSDTVIGVFSPALAVIPIQIKNTIKDSASTFLLIFTILLSHVTDRTAPPLSPVHNEMAKDYRI
jgi:hypothetical protein